MCLTNQSYFQQRAQAELQLAQQGSHPAVVKAHYEMARQYLDRIHSEGDSRKSTAELPMIA